MLADLHFLRPLWLLALLALPVVLWLLARQGRTSSEWQAICDPELLDYLGFEPGRRRRHGWLVLVAVGWIIASVAASGPAFRKQPEALYKRLSAQVVLFDLSRSMLAADLKPSRLDQARFKLIDLLDRIDEGQVALVAYAGEPFIVSPLTDDANTVRNMVNALHPNIMPAPGSEADEALVLAAELLGRVGDGTGQILVMSDDVNDAAIERAEGLAAQGITVSVLGVGTPEGAPIALPNGGVLTTGDGRIVIPQLDEERLRALAAAGGGRYARMASGGADLDLLLPGGVLPDDGGLAETERESARWKDDGPWLVLLLVPLAALAFRRGVVLVAFLAVGLSGPRPASAATWAGLWRTPEQRAEAAMAQESWEEAARLAEDPLRRGNAHFRSGDYEAAAAAYALAEGADAAYNLGNALARQERYEEAIAAYERTLTEAPEHEDAKHNKALLEELMQQQQQEQQDQQSEDSQDSEQEPQQSEGEGEQQESEDEQEPQQSDEGESQEDAEAQPQPLEEDLTEEEQQALEQWLRRIPDDPGGLLRRKFLLEYQRRGSPPPRENEDW